MSAPNYSAMAVALLWCHYGAGERDHLSLDEVDAQVRHVERCLVDATKVIAEHSALWTGARGDDGGELPREAELYRTIWISAAKGKVTP